MSMSKMFCLFLCLGCAVAQSSSDEEEQAQCDQCDNEGPAGEFTECDGCGDIVCDDCRECGEDCFVCRDAASGADSTTRLPPWLTNTETETETTESDGTATPDPPTDTALLSMFCASAGIAIVPAAENAAVPAENATAPADTPAVAAPAPTMTAAEIANTAIVGSMDTSSHFFDEWCIFLAGRVGEEVMNEMNAAPEMYNAHFEDFLILIEGEYMSEYTDIDLDDLFDRFTAEIQQERQPPRRTISDEGANLLDEEQEGTMTPQDAAWLGDHEVIERDLRANNVVN